MAHRHHLFFVIGFAILWIPLAQAEDACSTMLVAPLRFTAVVEQVAPLSSWEGTVTDVGELDPHYMVALTVSKLQASELISDPTVYPGAKLNLAIHSPVKLFRETPKPGATAELQLHTMQCDGTFRRFIEIERTSESSTSPQQFDGWLEVGRHYRAVVHQENGDIVPVVPLRGPMHHSVGIDWTNSDTDLPKFDTTNGTSTVVFEVLARETKHIGHWKWVTFYKCAIETPASSQAY